RWTPACPGRWRSRGRQPPCSTGASACGLLQRTQALAPVLRRSRDPHQRGVVMNNLSPDDNGPTRGDAPRGGTDPDNTQTSFVDARVSNRESITVPPDGKPDDQQPAWRRDFPIDWPQDHYVSRRDFTKFMVLT